MKSQLGLTLLYITIVIVILAVALAVGAKSVPAAAPAMEAMVALRAMTSAHAVQPVSLDPEAELQDDPRRQAAQRHAEAFDRRQATVSQAALLAAGGVEQRSNGARHVQHIAHDEHESALPTDASRPTPLFSALTPATPASTLAPRPLVAGVAEPTPTRQQVSVASLRRSRRPQPSPIGLIPTSNAVLSGSDEVKGDEVKEINVNVLNAPNALAMQQRPLRSGLQQTVLVVPNSYSALSSNVVGSYQSI